MKFVIGLLLAGIGYVTFDPTARAVVMSQTTGWIIGEYICAHVLIAVFVGMEFYAAMTVNMKAKDRSQAGLDGAAFFLGVLWPITVPGYYVGRYVVVASCEALARGMTSWTTKRREARRKMS